MHSKVAAENCCGGDTPAEPVPGADLLERITGADWGVVVCLLIIELLCFGVMAKQIGFYLDDWATFCQLHFANHNFIDVLKASLADPRMVTRPFQCLYYACTYMLFGDSPLGYHVLRCVIEFAGAAFLYMAAWRVGRVRLPAALAAAVFILFPSHDASHYWIGAGLGAGCGATLYLLSFWLAVEGALAKSAKMAALSALAFFLCAYCYEAFLPMLSLTFLGVLFVELKSRKPLLALKASLVAILPSLLIGISEPIYQRALVPLFSKVFLSPGTFDKGYALDVFAQGVSVTLGPSGWSFYAERAREALLALKIPEVVRLCGIGVSVIALILVSLRADARKPNVFASDEASTNKFTPKAALLYWLTACSLVLLCSYLTFAVAQGYTPILQSMINRVNMGASIPAALLLSVAATLPCLCSGGFRRWRFAGTMLLSVGFCLFFTLADWGFAPYWLQSWQVQKRVKEMVSQRAGVLSAGDTILLANTPRYVMWAPVFDGVWDFQSLVWMTLHNRQVSAGVVSERLDVKPQAIYDNSAGFLCATYKYAGLHLLIPNGNQLVPVSDAGQFVSKVSQAGMDFGLSPSTLERWKETSGLSR